MQKSPTSEGRVYCFGECRFIPDRQLLLRRGVPLRIGSRALDLLHALVQQAGDLVSKDELIRFAWPDTFVDESNLKVNMAYLRRAFSQPSSELPYIATVTGRGYRFVAPLRILVPPEAAALPDAVRAITGELPVIAPLIGREEDMSELAGALTESRLLTIVGPAGVGKTSLAIATAEQLGKRFRDGVCFVDLAAIEDPQLVAPAIAFALGMNTNLANILAGLADLLRNRELVLILDNCEHLLGAVANVADHLHDALPRLLIVTTSREPLRCRRESIYRLSPLRSPPDGSDLSAAAAMTFPAIELLVARAERFGYRLDDVDVAALAAITRQLDGIALAIELAAPCLASAGPANLLALLEHSIHPFVSLEENATPCHSTLKETLYWSYKLLSRHEARLLRHLAVFGGTFTLADVVGAFGHLATVQDVTAWLESLASKSLLSSSFQGGMLQYRLLDSTRSFATEMLQEEGEQKTSLTSYARYLLLLFEQAESEWGWRTHEDWTGRYGRRGGDLRRVIEWAFGAGRDPELAVRLTAAALTFWNEFSSVKESSARVATALSVFDGLRISDPILRVKLIAAHAINLCFSSIHRNEVAATLREGLPIARGLGDEESRLRMTMNLAGTNFTGGNYREALKILEQVRVGSSPAERSAAPDVQWHQLMNRFCCGEIRYALDELRQMACDYATFANCAQSSRFVIDRFVAIRTPLALAAWVAGEQRQAFDIAREAINASENLGHSASHAFTLVLSGIPISLSCGFTDVAQEWVTKLFELIALHQLDCWLSFAAYFQATIDASRGSADAVDRLSAAMDGFVKSGQFVHFPLRLATLAEAALAHQRVDLARSSLSWALEHAAQREERWCNAELSRILGLVRWHEGDALGAGQALEEAVQMARQSGALSFELRAATSRAELALEAGRSDAALAQLAAVYKRFDSGFYSTDVVAARALLDVHHAVSCER